MKTENDGPVIDPELDEAMDQVADKIAGRFVSQLTKWAIRTTIGLILFGVLWHYYDWGVWLFGGYIVLAVISLLAQIFLHHRLVNMLVDGMGDSLADDADD